MLIKFKKPDPRAGMTVRMDSRRGQEMVDAGAAVRVPEGGAEFFEAPVVEQAQVGAPAPVAARVSGKAKK